MKVLTPQQARMFVTLENNKHPLTAIYGDGIDLWNTVEVRLSQPWFLVEVEHPAVDESGDPFRMSRTMLFGSSDDIMYLAQSEGETEISLQAVSLMISVGKSKKSSSWSMQHLIEVWEADEPQDPGVTARIFAKAEGGHYVESLFGTALEQLHDWRRLLVLPNDTAQMNQQ